MEKQRSTHRLWSRFLLCSIPTLFSFIQLGCSEGFEPTPFTEGSVEQGLESPDTSTPETPPTNTPPVENPPAPATPPPAGNDNSNSNRPPAPNGLSICSRLNFEGLDWPSSLPFSERNAFALALNITGSFEGRGWDQLTGNFDGMGISMGIFQQNLGSGSLQPLLIQLHKKDPSVIRSIMSSERASSLLAMLSRWDSGFRPSNVSRTIEDYGFNHLDDPEKIRPYLDAEMTSRLSIQNTSRNQVSVQWAVQNALTGTRIKPEWLNELRTLALTAPYRSLQFAEAQRLHTRARQMFYDYGKTQLRSYLFFLDIVVQNGSIPRVDRDDYANWIRQNPNANEEQRLLKILEFRLRHVRPQWVNDVRARKTAIILGRGVVHQSQRDFDREYCANIKSVALGTVFPRPGQPSLP